MRQNIYDDPEFFAGYQAMRARRAGAHETTVKPLLDRLLPDLHGARVLDLGCGDGWLSRDAITRGARNVVAVDPSVRMLAEAARQTNDRRIEYRRGFVEDIELPAGSFDCAVSVFALHYVDDMAVALRRLAGWLAPSGVLVMVLEHPIYLASAPEREFEAQSHKPPRWLLQGYGLEGPRTEHWFVEGVVKYHRKLSTILNAVVGAGLRIDHVDEPIAGPPADARTTAEDAARPVVLGIRAVRE
jgi:ubiquinone/menaquinone biosynthesis C-methylase UbiE